MKGLMISQSLSEDTKLSFGKLIESNNIRRRRIRQSSKCDAFSSVILSHTHPGVLLP